MQINAMSFFFNFVEMINDSSFSTLFTWFFSQVQYSFTFNLIYNKNVTSIFSSFVCHAIHFSYKNLLKSKFNGKIIIFHFSSIFKKLKVTPNFLCSDDSHQFEARDYLIDSFICSILFLFILNLRIFLFA